MQNDVTAYNCGPAQMHITESGSQAVTMAFRLLADIEGELASTHDEAFQHEWTPMGS